MIGARFDDLQGNDFGSAYVFDLTTGGEPFKVTASDAEHFDDFGVDVGLVGQTALIGAFGDDDRGSSAGAAYLFAVPAPSTVVLTTLGLGGMVLAFGRRLACR